MLNYIAMPVSPLFDHRHGRTLRVHLECPCVSLTIFPLSVQVQKYGCAFKRMKSILARLCSVVVLYTQNYLKVSQEQPIRSKNDSAMTVPIIGTTKKQFVCKNTHKTRIVSELVDSYQLLLVERKTGM